MAYSKNPYLPKARAQAVRLVKSGKSIRLAARHFGVHASTVSRWVKRAGLAGLTEIPTLSSAPKNPKKIKPEIASKIIDSRPGRTYAKLIKILADQGIKVSLSSVKRIIKKSNNKI